MVTHVFETPLDSRFLDNIRSSICSYNFAQDILEHIIPDLASCSHSKFSIMDYGNFSWHGGFLFQNNGIYIPKGPSQLEVLQHYHDSPLPGHFEGVKTLELVTQNYWWPKVHQFFMDYVSICDVCY